MSELQKIDIDQFIKDLENMIDARDDIWQEEQYCNYREVIKIKEERYNPAREKVKEFFRQLIETVK